MHGTPHEVLANKLAPTEVWISGVADFSIRHSTCRSELVREAPCLAHRMKRSPTSWLLQDRASSHTNGTTRRFGGRIQSSINPWNSLLNEEIPA